MTLSDEIAKLIALKKTALFAKALGGLKANEAIMLNGREKVKLPSKPTFETNCMIVYKSKKKWLIKVKDLPVISGEYPIDGAKALTEEKVKELATRICRGISNRVYLPIAKILSKRQPLAVIKIPLLREIKAERLFIYNGVLYFYGEVRHNFRRAYGKYENVNFKNLPNVELKHPSLWLGKTVYWSENENKFYDKTEKELFPKNITKDDIQFIFKGMECGEKIYELKRDVISFMNKNVDKISNILIDGPTNKVGVIFNKNKSLGVFKDNSMSFDKNYKITFYGAFSGKIEEFAIYNEAYRKSYIKLKNGLSVCMELSYEEVPSSNFKYIFNDVGYLKDSPYLSGTIKIDKTKIKKKDILVFVGNEGNKISRYIIKKGNVSGEQVGEFILNTEKSKIPDKYKDSLRLFGFSYNVLSRQMNGENFSFYFGVKKDSAIFKGENGSIVISMMTIKDSLNKGSN